MQLKYGTCPVCGKAISMEVIFIISPYANVRRTTSSMREDDEVMVILISQHTVIYLYITKVKFGQRMF